MSLNGRLALVTGGASGIGEAVCRTLAAEGVTVVVADKQLEAAKNVAQSLPGDTKHRAMHVDVGDSSSVEQLFSSISDTFPQPLSIVVNSAGISPTAPLISCSDEAFDDVIRVNLKGTFLVVRAAGRSIAAYGAALPEGGASIVTIASNFAKSGYPNFGAYSASKAGVVALTKTAAQELAPYGIRCNSVLPGFTETPMTAASVSADMKAALISMIPLKRAAQPSEISEAIKFLCSPTASSFVTGAALDVSGGLNM
ncbi:(3R)-3-hydroxyacyl-CoA dehydrogenase-like [Amblyomma americanum]